MKRFRMLLVFALSSMLMLSACIFASCGEEKPETKDYTGYTEAQWLAEDIDSKTISYQFTGSWSLGGEYAMTYNVIVNLYEDSALVAKAVGGQTYTFYGYWSGKDTEDGKELSLVNKFGSDLSGGLIDHEYNYTLYEESDGGFSFSYTFYLAPGQYFRDAAMKGGTTVQYATFDAFSAAMAS